MLSKKKRNPLEVIPAKTCQPKVTCKQPTESCTTDNDCCDPTTNFCDPTLIRKKAVGRAAPIIIREEGTCKPRAPTCNAQTQTTCGDTCCTTATQDCIANICQNKPLCISEGIFCLTDSLTRCVSILQAYNRRTSLTEWLWLLSVAADVIPPAVVQQEFVRPHVTSANHHVDQRTAYVFSSYSHVTTPQANGFIDSAMMIPRPVTL